MSLQEFGNHFRIFSGQSNSTFIKKLSKEKEEKNFHNTEKFIPEPHQSFSKLKRSFITTETKITSFSSTEDHHHYWTPNFHFSNIEKLKHSHYFTIKETMKLQLKIFHWINIYRNTENIRNYCADLDDLPRRSTSARRRSWILFAGLALETVHFYYLFSARGLTELQRLVHFDFTLLVKTTPSVNCLSIGMFFLNLVAFYLLFWFDFTKQPTDQKGFAYREKMLAPAYLVSQVYCQQSSKTFLFRREESKGNSQNSQKGASVCNVIDKWMKQVSFLIDIYVSAIISKL